MNQPVEQKQPKISQKKVEKKAVLPTNEGVKEAPNKVPQKRWWVTLLWIVAILAWTFVAVFAPQILIGVIMGLTLPEGVLSSPLTNAIFSLLSYGITLVLLIVLPPMIFKNKIQPSTRERLGLMGLPTWTDIGLAPVGYVVTILIAAGLTALFSLFPWFDSAQAQELGYSTYMMGWERVLAYILLAIIAPIAEELVFRGWLYGKLRIKIPKWLAIILVSLLFGAIHLQWNVGLSVFALSVVNCLLREVTGTIYAGTLVHIIQNSVAFYLVYITGM